MHLVGEPGTLKRSRTGEPRSFAGTPEVPEARVTHVIVTSACEPRDV